MKHPFNYLGLLALPALSALLYFPTGNTDFIGFLGFAYFIRYFWVNPDELFLLTLRRAATGAFILEVALFPLLMLVRYLTAPAANPIPFALITRPMAWCAILLPSASSAAATGHAAAGYKLSESLRFSVPFFLLCLGGCMLSSYLFFPF